MSYGLFDKLFHSGRAFSFIDCRERRDYVAGHWFGSVNIPLSLFNTRLSILFKSNEIPINVLDWQDTASKEAIYQLKNFGFKNITTHKSNCPPNEGCGFVKGEYVWSKAFGEVVANSINLSEITPQEYLANYKNAMLFDVRPTAEYQEFTLPTSQSLPNSLLLANLESLKKTGTMSLLHCAGRTRSIIGAFTLIASGYDGPFSVFRGGTQAWQLDGHKREFEANRIFATENEAPDAVTRFLNRWQIPFQRMSKKELIDYISRHPSELLFDVSDDAASGQYVAEGIIKISGTNLIQQTDNSIACYHVPVTLIDHGSGSRAAFTAFWLSNMGFSVNLIYIDCPIETPSTVDFSWNEFKETNATRIDSHTLNKLIDAKTNIYDFRPSSSFQRSHLPHCQWKNVSSILALNPLDTPVAIITESIQTGHFISDCLSRHGWQVSGFYIWNKTDFDQSQLDSSELDLPIDKSSLFSGRHRGILKDASDYLAWEEGLPDQIEESIHEIWRLNLSRKPLQN